MSDVLKDVAVVPEVVVTKHIVKQAVKPKVEPKVEVTVAEKTIDVVDALSLVEKVSDVSIYSNCVSDWVTLHKVSSESEGWFKSTKALDLKTGVLIQVTTQQGDNVAEALQFCPGVKLTSLLNTL